jgi:general secretion pathway protein L
MPSRLLIRYRGPGQPLAWLAEDERGRFGEVRRGERPEAAALAAAGELLVLVPVEDCLLLEAEVAARGAEQLARAIPFAVEDQLAEPVEALHFSALPHPRGHGQLVAAVRRERLRGWIDDLAARGLRPDRMLVDALLLAPVADGARVLVDDGRALVRAGAARAFAATLDELPDWLALADLPRDADARTRLHVAGGRLPALDAARFIVEREAADVEPLAALAAGLRDAVAPDLLTGAFAPHHRGEPLRRLWRVAAACAAAAVLLGFGGLLLDRARLERRLATLEVEIAGVYAGIYPGAAVPANAVDRVRADYRALGGAPAAGGALELLAQVAPVLGAAPQTFLKGIEYRGGALELVLLAPGVSALDAVRESIVALPGLSAELAAASASERGTEGRVRVTRRSP